MAGFKVEIFKGMRPRVSALKLPIGEAGNAQNCDLGSGDIQPFYDKATEQAITSGRQAKTIYRFDNDGSPVWFEWDDYVDVVRGPVKDDVLERTYYTGDTLGNGAPKMTSTELVGTTAPYPAGWLYIGVPAPTTKPVLTVPGLPEDVPAADRLVQANSIKKKWLEIDTVEYTVYPGTGTADTEWTLNASALGDIAFDIGPGTSFKVASVINSNKVTLNSLTDSGVFAKTYNSDKTTVNDWDPFDNNGSTQAADFIGWRIPAGAEVTIVGHNLIVGDVITVSASLGGISWATSIGASVWENTFGTQSWADPFSTYEDGVQVWRVSNARIWANSTFQTDFVMMGSFTYDVDRTASDVSELEDRQYVYTYVTSTGEEGPPSPVSDVYEVLDTSTVSISALAQPPTIGYDITNIRIYRTNSTEAGTEYQFVKEIAVASTTTDAVASADLGEVIGSTSWDPPPIGLSGLTEMPNGMLVGFDGKNIYFCEPYYPHAWPSEYDQAVGHEIVGLASFSNSLAVVTKGHPYILTGAHPRNVNIRPIKFNQSCLSKESIATDGDRVYYASPDGLVEISVNGVRLATEAFLTKENWATYSPSTMRSSFHEGRYYGFYDFDISAIPAVISAEISGTVTNALESDIINGGDTVILTLTNDIWVADGTSFNAQRQAIINGLTAATSQTLGWNNIVRDAALVVANVVRTSDTVCTITLPTAAGYSVTSDEVITATIPAAALSVSNAAVICGSTFTVTAEAPAATVTLGGTADTATEANIVTGGYTVTLTLTNDTWVTAGTNFDAERQGIIDGLAATTNEVNGFNDNVPQEIAVTDVVRTSDTLVTITLPAVAAYNITVNEAITAVVPSTALTTSIVDATAVNTISILTATATPSALITGTAVSATENELVAGGKTVIVTLSNETFVAAGTGPIGTTAQSQAFLDAILATTSQTLGWNNVVIPGLTVATHLVRTNSTVATITLQAESTYSIASNETIGLTIPAGVLTLGLAIVATNTFGITAQAPVTCALTGTATATIAENDIVDGGKTIILTLSSDTWLAAGTGPIGSTANTQAIIDGITSAQVEALGWNAQVRDIYLAPTDVVRTNDTVATITLPASANYNITAQETITATVPAAALNISASAVVASPTFAVAIDVAATVALTGTITTASANTIRDSGATVILTMSDDTWVASGATFDAQRQAIIDGMTAATSQTNGWNNEIRDVIAVTTVIRTSNTIVTITIPATATYALTSLETITVTVPAAAIVVATSAVVAAPTFALDETLSTRVMVGIANRSSATTRPAYSAYAADSFTDWAEVAVDADSASSSSYSYVSMAYSAADDRWVMASRKAGDVRSIVIFTSDNNGTNWTQRALFNTGAPVYTTIYRTTYYNVTNAVFLTAAGSYPNLMYSSNSGVTWAESATPWASISKTGGYSPSKMYYGGTNYVYSDPFDVTVDAGVSYQKYGVRSGSLASTLTTAWTQFQLTFDGAYDSASTLSFVSAGGKIYYLASETGSPWNFYLSSVPHGSTTETYIGKISGSYKAYFTMAAASPTVLVMIDSGGYLMTCTIASAGTASNWSYPVDTSDRITTDSVSFKDLIYDPGDAGKEGLGFIAVGQYNSSGAGRIYTSADGVTWALSETLTLSDREPTAIAANNPADVT